MARVIPRNRFALKSTRRCRHSLLSTLQACPAPSLSLRRVISVAVHQSALSLSKSHTCVIPSGWPCARPSLRSRHAGSRRAGTRTAAPVSLSAMSAIMSAIVSNVSNYVSNFQQCQQLSGIISNCQQCASSHRVRNALLVI